MLRRPDHRYQAALEATRGGVLPVDPRTQELVTVLGGGAASTPVVYAHDLYANAEHRQVVDAFILSATKFDLVSRVLGIPEEVLVAYQHLFMDTSVFRNRLELMSFAASYEGDAYGKELVRTAVQVGTDYLLWAYGSAPDVDSRLVVRRTMIDAFFRGMAHKGNGLNSSVSKEALKWWSTAIKNAELLEKIDPRTSKQAHEELRMAIEGRDDSVPAADAPVPLEEILH